MTEPTICAECKHRVPMVGICIPPDSGFLCEASPLEAKVNFVTGQTFHIFPNGDKPMYGQEFGHCRDINTDGKCKLYEAKP